jgi:hypothetical protein
MAVAGETDTGLKGLRAKLSKLVSFPKNRKECYLKSFAPLPIVFATVVFSTRVLARRSTT